MFDLLDDLTKAALSPVVDGLDILDGLTEGEIRTKAIARLGADAVNHRGITR
jgi:hypothetical protein